MDIDFACRFILLISAVEYASSLECWKCIADNCEMDPDENYKADKMSCSAHDSACMKVEYTFKTKSTGHLYKSVIRTCSAGLCIPVNDTQFDKCTRKKGFHVRGCVKRMCCDDRDLCNDMPSDVISLWVLLFLVCTGGYANV